MKPASQFETLDKKRHDRLSFDCGEAELNDFLQTRAAKHMANNLSVTRVLPAVEQLDNGKLPICAFYTLAYSSVERTDFPQNIAKKLPKYPIPVFLMAQLSVHVACQGQGLGGKTVAVALRHLWDVNQQMRGFAVVVDCLNEQVVRFYERFGFTYLCEYRGRTRLYLPIKMMSELFGA